MRWMSLAFFIMMMASLSSGVSSCVFWSESAQCSGIFWQLRVPRVLGAIWSGWMFATAGVVSQGLFRNPLASPGILGLTSGAVLGVSLAFLAGWSFAIPWCALLGTLGVGGVMLLLSKRAITSDRLLLAGVAISSFLGAIQSLVVSRLLNSPHEIAALMRWMLGGVSTVGYERLWMGLPLGGLAITLFPTLSRQLDLALLGEERAQSLGCDVRRLRMLSVACLGLLVSSGVLVSGILPFVGLMVPYLTRLYIGVRHSVLLMCAGLNGATIVLFADSLGRWIGGVHEIEAGIVMGLLGSPCFFWMLKNYRSL